MNAIETFSLNGKTALVTGASRGLGRALAIALGEAGANVVCASSRPDGARATADCIRGIERSAWTVHADLADRTAVDAMSTDVEQQAPPIDILVNNAGDIARHRAEEFPVEDWDRVLRTNLDAAWLLSQRFGKQMIARGSGKIVNVASVLSYSGGVTVAPYAASKHAIAGLTKALANEWASHNVQVNAIAPGYFVTDNTQQLRENPGRMTQINARIPAGRWGEPADLAGAIVFLASAASNYVNGHVLVVDGGWMAR
jgi:2-dehydro-3-deoxy-D-gluconate 5-dehydrogenase